MKIWRKTIFAIVSTLVISALLIVRLIAQSPQGTIVLLEQQSSGQVILRFRGGFEFDLTIEASQCYAITPDYGRIAISQKVNPTSITIYTVYPFVQIANLSWRSEWQAPCRFGFMSFDEQYLSLPLEGDDLERQIVDTLTGQVVGTFDPTDASSFPTFIPQPSLVSFDPVQLPGILAERPPFKVAPNNTLVVYQNCVSGVSQGSRWGEWCVPPDAMVIYDLPNQREVEVLQNADFLQTTAVEALHNVYIWSPSSHYLVYPSDTYGVPMIYDVLTDTYIDTSPIDAFNSPPQPVFDYHWSPDETRLAFSVVEPAPDPNNLDHPIRGISVFDLVTETYTVLPDRFQYREFQWMPDGQSFIVRTLDNVALEVDFAGNQTVIGQNVERILTYYPPVTHTVGTATYTPDTSSPTTTTPPP